MAIRIYEIEKRNYPSVTSVLSYVFGTNDHLIKWSIKIGIDAVIQAEKRGKLTKKEKLEIGEAARHQVLKQSSVQGTAVHKYIETHLKREVPEVDPDYAPYYDGFVAWQEVHSLVPVFQEKKVWHDFYGYAGRLDFYGYLDGRPVIIDFKTSKHVRSEYGLQLAAYRECLVRMGYEVEAMYVLHLTKRGCYLVEFHDPFKVFVSLLDVFNWKLATDPDRSKPGFFSIASDEDAIQNEQKETGPSEDDPVATTAMPEVPTQLAEASERLQVDEVNAPRPSEPVAPAEPTHLECRTCRGLEGTPRPGTVEPTSPPVRKRGRPRKVPLPESPVRGDEAPLEVIPPRIRADESELVELDPHLIRVFAKHQTTPDA